VRNFGLVWVSGRRTGGELDAARRARRRWEEIGAEVSGVGFRANGSLTVAMTEAERTVMVDYAQSPEAADRGVTFLEPDQVRACNAAVLGDVAGALHCRADGVVEPRRAPGALREHLTRQAPDRYCFHPSRRVSVVEAHGVRDATGTQWAGDLVVVATGAAYDALPATAAFAPELRRVRLQMFETEPYARALTTSLADADSLRYYPAYEGTSLGALGDQSALAAEHHLQLLLVQRPDGGLTVGDTHAYDEPFDFALCEDATEELLARSRRMLGGALPPIRRRWAGVYAQCRDGRVCLREEIAPDVWLVTGPGGRGMTCAPAIAQDTLRAAGAVA
jgi:FAD dependent oxidoreductase TIGR03364